MDIVTIYELFPDQEACIRHLEKVRWSGTPTCPYCDSPASTPVAHERRHHCNNCNTSYSVTVGTIFHHTHMPLQKWFLALCLTLNAKKGLSARQLARDINVHRNTAWRIAMKIREAMSETGQRELLRGVVECDEVYIGGKPRRGTGPHKRGRGTKKTPVVGFAERGGKVRAQVVKRGDLSVKKLSALVRRNVDVNETLLITDEYKGYLGISRFMQHETVNHREWYVRDYRHTNTIESFWSLLKRGIVGQYHKVSLHHLPRYIDEFCYRHNNRNRADLFELTVRRAVGART